MKFQRQPLREAIQKEILTRIVSGSLPAGQRINETHLAEDLGLSRTPLREAMLTLAATGHLASDMGKGFAVPPLRALEMIQIVEMLGALQPLALKKVMPVSPVSLMELSNLINRARVSLTRNPHGPKAGLTMASLIFNFNEVLFPEKDGELLLVAQVKRLEGLAARYWVTAISEGLPTEQVVDSLQNLYDVIRLGQKDQASHTWGEHIAKFGKMALEFIRD